MEKMRYVAYLQAVFTLEGQKSSDCFIKLTKERRQDNPDRVHRTDRAFLPLVFQPFIPKCSASLWRSTAQSRFALPEHQ